MLLKTITKICFLVISFSLFSGCSYFTKHSAKANPDARNSDEYAAPQAIAKLESKEITESSGIAASKCQPNVFWTHNDSGDGAFIFAFDSGGKHLGTYKVAGAKNTDWEDLDELKTADGRCILYIAETGNNARIREEMRIYKVAEPQISAADNSSNRKNPVETEAAQTIKFTYPDSRHDAETLMVQPQTGDVYILSKELTGAAGIYKLAAKTDVSTVAELEKIGEFSAPAIPNGLVTGGSIAPDGKRLIICDYVNAYELKLPDGAKNFDEIWTQKPQIIELGDRDLGEAVAYSADGKSIYATSEGDHPPLIEVKRKMK